jgi:hypothetical protein
MARFQQSSRGGGEPDPQEALRRAREAVARERASRDEDHSARNDDTRAEDGLDRVGDAMREHDERQAREQ